MLLARRSDFYEGGCAVGMPTTLSEFSGYKRLKRCSSESFLAHFFSKRSGKKESGRDVELFSALSLWKSPALGGSSYAGFEKRKKGEESSALQNPAQKRNPESGKLSGIPACLIESHEAGRETRDRGLTSQY